MFKNKRGISIAKLLIIELILGLVVFGGVSFYLYSLEDNKLYEKKLITRDLSLLSNTIQSVPGNVAYQYVPKKAGDSMFDFLHVFDEEDTYNFEFYNNQITISENFYSKLSYPYFYNNNLEHGLYILTNATRFTLTNFNNAFSIHAKGMVGLKHDNTALIQESPSTEYKLTSNVQPIKLLVIDAVGGHFSSGIQDLKQGKAGAEHFLSYEITANLAQLLSLEKTIIQARTQKQPQQDFTMEKRLNLIPKKADLILSIGMSLETLDNSGGSTSNPIYAYVPENNEQSSFLATTILDEIIKVFPEISDKKVLTTTQQQDPTLFVNQQTIDTTNTKSKLAIKLELGNLNLENNPLYTEDAKSKIAQAIKKGIEKYEASKVSVQTSILCNSDGYKSLVGGTPKQTLVEETAKIKGKTWVGKLSGNANRDVAVVIPENSDCGREFEIIYYFHGSHGYLLNEQVPACITGTSLCEKKEWYTNPNKDSYNKCPKDQGSTHDSGLEILKEVLEETEKLGKDPKRNVILVYPFSGGPRAGGCTGTGYDSYWMYPAKDESIDILHQNVLDVLSQLDSRVKVGSITIKGHSGGGVPLYRITESGFKVNRIDFLDASYGNWAQKAYETAINNNPNVEFNIIVKPDTDTDEQGKSLKDKSNVNYIYTKTKHGNIPKEFFSMESNNPILLEPLIQPELSQESTIETEKTRTIPKTCTYYDKGLKKKSYSTITGEEIHDSGCTLCREDQETITIAGHTIEVCWKYKKLVEAALQNIVNSGFPIYEIDGFREGRTYNKGKDFGEHPYGIAIDINRDYNGLYNKCKKWNVEKCTLSIAGKKNPERQEEIEGTITKNSYAYVIMDQIGWIWGGDWETNQKDYMHFSLTGE